MAQDSEAERDAERAVCIFHHAHARESPDELGVAALLAPAETADFSQLNEVFGTTILLALAEGEPSWNPAREFKLDVTRHLRVIVNGDKKFHSFAPRVLSPTATCLRCVGVAVADEGARI